MKNLTKYDTLYLILCHDFNDEYGSTGFKARCSEILSKEIEITPNNEILYDILTYKLLEIANSPD